MIPNWPDFATTNCWGDAAPLFLILMGEINLSATNQSVWMQNKDIVQTYKFLVALR